MSIGRPKVHIDIEEVELLRYLWFKCTKIAELIGIMQCYTGDCKRKEYLMMYGTQPSQMEIWIELSRPLK